MRARRRNGRSDRQSSRICAAASVISSAAVILGRRPALRLTQEIIHQHEKCGDKVVEVGEYEHEATFVVDVAVATPTFDALSFLPGPAITAATNSESLI
jgi:hypothetical protein